MTPGKTPADTLRALIDAAGVTQLQALNELNEGLVKPIAVSTWKAYLSASDSKRRRICPDSILRHAVARLTRGGTHQQGGSGFFE